MTPLETLRHGGLGIVNDDPSLVLTEWGQDKFDVTLSNSSNRLGITKSMRFEGRTDKRSWSDLLPGSYSRERVKHALTLSPPNEDGESGAQFFNGLEGSHVISEQFSGMYVVSAQRYLKSGQQTDRSSQKIGVFIEIRGKTQLHLVNLKNTMIFKYKGGQR